VHPAETNEGEQNMQLIMTFMAVVAGLAFSIAVALVVEEWIFGQVFRVFFDRKASVGPSTLALQPVRLHAQPRHKEESYGSL